MSPEWFTLIGVLLGSVISQAGSIISRLTSRESARKEIFEARFKKTELLMEDAIKKLHEFDIEIISLDLSKTENKSLCKTKFREFIPAFVEIKLSIISLSITNNMELTEFADRFFSNFAQYFREITDILSSENPDMNKTSGSIIPLLDTYCLILNSLPDTF